MTPGSFDIQTCQELVGDERQRSIAEKGRKAADEGGCPPERAPARGSYWSQVQDEAAYCVELAAYEKRLARIERMKTAQKEKA